MRHAIVWHTSHRLAALYVPHEKVGVIVFQTLTWAKEDPLRSVCPRFGQIRLKRKLLCRCEDNHIASRSSVEASRKIGITQLHELKSFPRSA